MASSLVSWGTWQLCHVDVSQVQPDHLWSCDVQSWIIQRSLRLILRNIYRFNHNVFPNAFIHICCWVLISPVLVAFNLLVRVQSMGVCLGYFMAARALIWFDGELLHLQAALAFELVEYAWSLSLVLIPGARLVLWGVRGLPHGLASAALVLFMYTHLCKWRWIEGSRAPGLPIGFVCSLMLWCWIPIDIRQNQMSHLPFIICQLLEMLPNRSRGEQMVHPLLLMQSRWFWLPVSELRITFHFAQQDCVLIE